MIIDKKAEACITIKVYCKINDEKKIFDMLLDVYDAIQIKNGITKKKIYSKERVIQKTRFPI